ncbi:hypothetical protein C1H46_027898 [Malus baccata]|uniref:Uncharacterized protein n=1 Tax=Malus baccata TaxID=106549 RepID=A0A540LJB0_MALBA|nr:hypothetical protein C1H46_027898 [Malus baccata]
MDGISSSAIPHNASMEMEFGLIASLLGFNMPATVDPARFIIEEMTVRRQADMNIRASCGWAGEL